MAASLLETTSWDVISSHALGVPALVCDCTGAGGFIFQFSG